MPDIQSEELMTVESFQVKGTNGTKRIRIVRYTVDGKQGAPKLEKRGFYTGQDGAERSGKAEGFTVRDLENLVPKMDKIMETMKNA